MSLVSDDELKGVDDDLDIEGDQDSDFSGAENTASEYFNNADVKKEVALMAAELEMLGYADDPELLGAWLKNLISRVRTGIQKIKARKAGGSLSLTLPSASITPGVDESAAASPGGAGGLLKNPLVLWGGAAAAFILITAMMKKK